MLNSVDIDAVAGLVSGLSLAVFTFLKPFETMQVATQLAVIAESSIDHAEILSWVYNDVKWVITLDNLFQMLSLPVAVVSGYKIIIKPAISWVKDKLQKRFKR